MTDMKNFLSPRVAAVLLAAAATFLAASGPSLASSGPDIRMEPAPGHRLDDASLQRGARNFVNYCLGCHSARFMRYNRLTDLGQRVGAAEHTRLRRLVSAADVRRLGLGLGGAT